MRIFSRESTVVGEISQSHPGQQSGRIWSNLVQEIKKLFMQYQREREPHSTCEGGDPKQFVSHGARFAIVRKL